MDQPRIVWLTDTAGTELAVVGGKNASLGIMLRELGAEGIKVPEGFATTASAYREYVDAAGLRDVIADQIRRYRDRAELASVPGVVQISAAWGLGESVVSGRVDPDEYLVFKPRILWDDLRPILSRRVGAKEIKVVYGESGGTITVPTTPASRRSWCRPGSTRSRSPLTASSQ